VYLHNTPNHDLFEKAERSFSHGRIRLPEPAWLAEWVPSLNDADWDLAKIQDILESEQRMVKSLSKPLAVHLTYEQEDKSGDGS